MDWGIYVVLIISILYLDIIIFLKKVTHLLKILVQIIFLNTLSSKNTSQLRYNGVFNPL